MIPRVLAAAVLLPLALLAGLHGVVFLAIAAAAWVTAVKGARAAARFLRRLAAGRGTRVAVVVLITVLTVMHPLAVSLIACCAVTAAVLVLGARCRRLYREGCLLQGAA